MIQLMLCAGKEADEHGAEEQEYKHEDEEDLRREREEDAALLDGS